MDLFLGNYEVDSSEGVTKPSPLRQERDWKFFAVSAVEDVDSTFSYPENFVRRLNVLQFIMLTECETVSVKLIRNLMKVVICLSF
jgi:hypothetical protein